MSDFTPLVRPARLLVALGLVLAQAGGYGQVGAPTSRLAVSPLFGPGSVWQRGAPVALKGAGEAGRTIRFESGDLGEADGTIGLDGRWTLDLPAHAPGGPYSARLTSAGDTIGLDSIYVGDVYVCSGQSNMEWEVVNADGGERSARADRDPLLRHLKIPKLAAPQPVDTLPGGLAWEPTAPGFTERFTAVGYYFARALRERYPDLPIGLVNSSWGGSIVEAWLPASGENRPVSPPVGDDRRQTWAELQQRYPAAFTPAGEPVSARDARPALDSLHPQGAWEYRGWPDVDGVIWYRTELELTEAEARGGARLALGPIDDSDSTFVNGSLAGGMEAAHATARHYALAPGALAAGRNTIAVRVEDTGGGGGIMGPQDSVYLQTAGRRIPLGVRAWAARPERVRIDSLGGSEQRPTMLYNAMLAPLSGLRAKGVLWYQGESNADNAPRAARYATQLATLTEMFRGELGGDDSLAMLVVELPEYTAAAARAYAPDDTWPLIRAAQQAAVGQDPNYATVVTLGLGDADDIHPRDKLSVGERLADEALRVVYGELDGPAYARPLEVAENGGSVTLRFSGVGSGLKASGGQSIGGFAVQDGAGDWTDAEVQLVAPDRLRVVAAPGQTIARVAYAWANNPAGANLVNGFGLPVSSFRLAIAE